MPFLALVLLLAALASALLLRALIPLLRRRLLDQPNARSSHRLPTPRGGGVAFVLVSAAASGLAVIPVVALPLALVGILDDRHNVSTAVRYGVQLATALVLILLSPLALPWLLLPLLVIAVTAVINFTNFMDGLDGLVAGCMAVTLAAAALSLPTSSLPNTSLALTALVGALIGFLYWNWSPAKVFMGDVGSTFLGAVFAGAVLQSPSWPEALGLLLVATPLLGDACLCLPRRLLAGQPVFQAHRLHLFQRLHQAGWRHDQVSWLYIAATAVLALALLIGHWPWVIGLAIGELLLGVWLDQTMAISFAAASR